MKKTLVITAAMLFIAGGTLWSAISLPTASAPIPQESTTKTRDIATSTPSESTTPDTMRRRRGRGHRGGGGGDHICGTRFCGHHCHHHGHVWCDGHSHWYCPGHH